MVKKRLKLLKKRLDALSRGSFLVTFLFTLVATEVLGRWGKKRKKDYPGARP
jgi:hypothetical protein